MFNMIDKQEFEQPEAKHKRELIEQL